MKKEAFVTKLTGAIQKVETGCALFGGRQRAFRFEHGLLISSGKACDF
jgi:hypothetical protein